MGSTPSRTTAPPTARSPSPKGRPAPEPTIVSPPNNRGGIQERQETLLRGVVSGRELLGLGQQAAVVTQAQDSRANGEEQGRDLRIGDASRTVEGRSAVRLGRGVDAVDDDGMHVQVGVESGAETLKLAYSTTLAAVDSVLARLA